ncbi:MAG: NAD(P)H-dependent oxidoreductase subunit E [Perlabentimonas sp.]
MSGKKEVVICLGSSCFSRGNKNLLRAINQFIKDNNIEDKIYFHGGHCFGQCADGPILKVDNELYTSVVEQKMISILSNSFEI